MCVTDFIVTWHNKRQHTQIVTQCRLQLTLIILESDTYRQVLKCLCFYCYEVCNHRKPVTRQSVFPPHTNRLTYRPQSSGEKTHKILRPGVLEWNYLLIGPTPIPKLLQYFKHTKKKEILHSDSVCFTRTFLIRLFSSLLSLTHWVDCTMTFYVFVSWILIVSLVF